MHVNNQIEKFKESTKAQDLNRKEQKSLTFNNTIRLCSGRLKFSNRFEDKITPIGKGKKEYQ